MPINESIPKSATSASSSISSAGMPETLAIRFRTSSVICRLPDGGDGAALPDLVLVESFSLVGLGFATTAVASVVAGKVAGGAESRGAADEALIRKAHSSFVIRASILLMDALATRP